MNKYTFSSWFPDYIPKKVKKYKLLKDIPWCKAWTIFEVRKNYIEFWNWSFYEKDLTPDWFEEIEDNFKDNLKVWDYYVKEYSSWVCAYKSLKEIEVWQDTFIDGSNIKNTGYIIRKPTEEELKKYFR